MLERYKQKHTFKTGTCNHCKSTIPIEEWYRNETELDSYYPESVSFCDSCFENLEL
jgi:hypothetical protein